MRIGDRPINRRNPLTVRLLLRLYRWRLRPLFRALSVIMGVDIAYRDYRDLVMPHPVGIVLHGKMEFGARVTIYQNVTVASHPRIDDAAKLGDDVTICAGAVLVGPVRIGDGAIVAANAVVTTDVPPGVTVAGIPAKVVSKSRYV